MRTTLDIDDAVLAAARQIARTRGESTGTVISELARKGLQNDRQSRRRHSTTFPVFDVPVGAEALTLQSVGAIIDHEGLPARR
jgi:hypothetical protein